MLQQIAADAVDAVDAVDEKLEVGSWKLLTLLMLSMLLMLKKDVEARCLEDPKPIVNCLLITWMKRHTTQE